MTCSIRSRTAPGRSPPHRCGSSPLERRRRGRARPMSSVRSPSTEPDRHRAAERWDGAPRQAGASGRVLSDRPEHCRDMGRGARQAGAEEQLRWPATRDACSAPAPRDRSVREIAPAERRAGVRSSAVCRMLHSLNRAALDYSRRTDYRGRPLRDGRRRILIGPRADAASTTSPRCMMSTSPWASSRRAASRTGSMSSRQASPPTARAASEGQIVDVGARCESRSRIARSTSEAGEAGSAADMTPVCRLASRVDRLHRPRSDG